MVTCKTKVPVRLFLVFCVWEVVRDVGRVWLYAEVVEGEARLVGVGSCAASGVCSVTSVVWEAWKRYTAAVRCLHE
jgi:hypothetical protein